MKNIIEDLKTKFNIESLEDTETTPSESSETTEKNSEIETSKKPPAQSLDISNFDSYKKSSEILQKQNYGEKVEDQILKNRDRKRSWFQKRPTVHTIDASDLLSQYRPENLSPGSAAKAFVDVTGYDVIEPKYLGMTTDQRREVLRNERAENEMYDIDE